MASITLDQTPTYHTIYVNTETMIYFNQREKHFAKVFEDYDKYEPKDHVTGISADLENDEGLYGNFAGDDTTPWPEDELVEAKQHVSLIIFRIKNDWGEPLDPDRHGLGNEVKAVTYHGLRAEATPSGWEAEVILAI